MTQAIKDKDYYKPTANEICRKIQKDLLDNTHPCKVGYAEMQNNVVFTLQPTQRVDLNKISEELNLYLGKLGIKCSGFTVIQGRVARCIISKAEFRL
jgi:hypothetical protein